MNYKYFVLFGLYCVAEDIVDLATVFKQYLER